MSMAALRAIRPMKLPPTQKLVLWALADQADDAGEAWPSIAGLMDATCLCERATRGALRGLEACGVIKTIPGGGRNRTTTYRIIGAEKGAFRAGFRHEVPRLDGEERGHLLPEKGHLMPERGHVVPERGHEMPPNPHEPSRTLIEPKKKRTRATIEPDTLPAWLPPDAWDAWRAHRRRGWSATTAALCIRNLGKLRDQGHDPRAVIEQSIANGWSGLFPIRGTVQYRPSATEGRRAASMALFKNGLQQPGETGIIDGEAEYLP